MNPIHENSDKKSVSVYATVNSNDIFALREPTQEDRREGYFREFLKAEFVFGSAIMDQMDQNFSKEERLDKEDPKFYISVFLPFCPHPVVFGY